MGLDALKLFLSSSAFYCAADTIRSPWSKSGIAPDRLKGVGIDVPGPEARALPAFVPFTAGSELYHAIASALDKEWVTSYVKLSKDVRLDKIEPTGRHFPTPFSWKAPRPGEARQGFHEQIRPETALLVRSPLILPLAVSP